MELKYTLTRDFGRASEKVFFKADDGLTIKLESCYVLDNLLVVITDGKVKQTIRAKGNTFDVPESFVKAGTLSFDISMMKGGRAIKTFACEPVTIIEQGGTLFAYEAYELMRNDIEALRKENKELISHLETLTKRLERVERHVTELWENEEK